MIGWRPVWPVQPVPTNDTRYKMSTKRFRIERIRSIYRPSGLSYGWPRGGAVVATGGCWHKPDNDNGRHNDDGSHSPRPNCATAVLAPHTSSLPPSHCAPPYPFPNPQPLPSFDPTCLLSVAVLRVNSCRTGCDKLSRAMTSRNKLSRGLPDNGDLVS